MITLLPRYLMTGNVGHMTFRRFGFWNPENLIPETKTHRLFIGRMFQPILHYGLKFHFKMLNSCRKNFIPVIRDFSCKIGLGHTKIHSK